MGQQTKEKWVQAVHVSNGRINVLWPEWAEKRKELKHYCQIGSSGSDTTGYTTGSRLSFLPAIMTTSSRMHGEFLHLLFLQAHRETTAHFIATGWTAIATNPIGQRVPVQTRGILHGPEEQSRPRVGKSIGVTDQPQYPRL